MMELSFHSKESSGQLQSSVSYEEESSVGEMLTELKKPASQDQPASAVAAPKGEPEEREI